MKILQLSVDVSDGVTPQLDRLDGIFSDRELLHLEIAAAEENMTREYLRQSAQLRTKTRDRLGAESSGHMGRASSSIESGSDRESAWITIPRNTGLGRAFYDIVLTTPTRRGKKWIAIPAAASAYGRRPEQLPDLKFIPLGDDLAVLVKRAKSTGEFIPVYWLKKEVRISQDRSLLPSDQDFTREAAIATRNVIKRTVKTES